MFNEGWINVSRFIIEFLTVTSCHWSFSEQQCRKIFTVESHLHELLLAVAAAELCTICHEGSKEEPWNSSPDSCGKHWHWLHDRATGSFMRQATACYCNLPRNDSRAIAQNWSGLSSSWNSTTMRKVVSGNSLVLFIQVPLIYSCKQEQILCLEVLFLPRFLHPAITNITACV